MSLNGRQETRLNQSHVISVWLTLTLCTLFGTSVAVAQEGQPTDKTAKLEPDDSVTAIDDEDIDAALKLVDESSEIDDVVKTQARELYAQTKTAREEASQQRAAAAAYNAWVVTAAQDIEAAKERRDSPLDSYDLSTASSRRLDELAKDRSALEQTLVDARAELLKAQREPQRRLERKSKIPEEIAAAQADVKKLDEDLQIASAASDPPILVRARTTLLQSRRQAQLARIAALESERDAFEAQGELPRLRIDLATARIRQAEEQVSELLAIVTDKRVTGAAVQASDAEAALRSVSAATKPHAKQVVDFANRRGELAAQIQSAAANREQVGKMLKRWRKDFARVQEQAAEVDSDDLGTMLIEKRASLPSISQLKRASESSNRKIRSLRGELYKLEDRRDDLSDIDAVVTAEVERWREAQTTATGNTEAELTDVFSLELRILDSLLKDANRNYSLHLETRTDEISLLRLVEEYNNFINERIFGVRSTDVLGMTDFAHASDAMGWLFSEQSWGDARVAAGRRIRNAPQIPIAVVAGIALLMLVRRRTRRQLHEQGRVASSASCRSFWPTSWTLLLTTLLAAPWPLLIWGIGWVLRDAESDAVQAVANACPRMAVALFVLEWIRQACQPNGLAVSHFKWPSQTCRVLYSRLRVLLLLGIPLVLVVVITENQPIPEYRSSLGRLAAIAFLFLIAFTADRLFRAKGGVFTEASDLRTSRLHNLRHALIVAVPVSLSLLTICGYQYTAFVVTIHLLRTMELVLVLLLLAALLFRWVRLRRRRIRWKQLTETNTRNDDEAPSSGEPDTLAAQEEMSDLVAMNQQTRHLIKVSLGLVGLLGMSAIWMDFFPALSPLINKQLWTVADVGGGVRVISVVSVLASILTVALAVIAQRNTPGLVNFLLLGRFGMESSTRYAISTLSRYCVLSIGILYACFLLGITWAKAQWLIAALGVGLGFGLQEVVANFVCGILLLFERPIRLGDVVTLGDTTGVVIRIGARATTVRNFDRQEVVIPNKELITARITNWTLSDQLNRIVLNIGIAYGSDTGYVRDLLIQILSANSRVLQDPPPQVAFEQFGDSSLNFTIMAHLANIDMAERLETLHELNTEIHERFAKEGIDIPFPQRVLHHRGDNASADFSDVAAQSVR